MTAQARRRSTDLVASATWLAACALASLAGCGSDPPTEDDPCADLPVIPGGSVELGVGTGSTFTALVDGQDFSVELGGQGLYMFVVTVRTLGLEVGSGDQEGVVVFSAFDASDAPLSIDFRCRVREFSAVGSTLNTPEYRVLSLNYGLALRAEVTNQIEGRPITLDGTVRDTLGHRATARVTVVGHLPR
jgi:hypothetical protein